MLRDLIAAAPGAAAGIDVLTKDPGAKPEVVGVAIGEALGAAWKPASI